MAATPLKYKKIVTSKLGTDFRDVTQLIEVELPEELKPDHVVIKTSFVGLNASDINLTNGNYTPGVQPPFDAGFEAIGEIVRIGASVTNVQRGTAVYYFNTGGAFAEYIVAPAALVSPIPAMNPGTTASISLEKMGELKSGQTVLVTAAAGGTGLFAVQLAKLAGNHVIGSCGSDEKAKYLKDLGCDRVINYKKENMAEVLQKEYPKGIDIVYECVGGSTLATAVDNIAVDGKIILIGMISGYADQSFTKNQPISTTPGYPTELKLLLKSASMRGFYLPNHMQDLVPHAVKLIGLYSEGKLKSVTDCTFKGIEHIADAIEHLHQGKNIGKVVVQFN